jgi:hypothetical protein
MLSHLLDKFNIKYEDLNATEREALSHLLLPEMKEDLKTF